MHVPYSLSLKFKGGYIQYERLLCNPVRRSSLCAVLFSDPQKFSTTRKRVHGEKAYIPNVNMLGGSREEIYHFTIFNQTQIWRWPAASCYETLWLCQIGNVCLREKSYSKIELHQQTKLFADFTFLSLGSTHINTYRQTKMSHKGHNNIPFHFIAKYSNERKYLWVTGNNVTSWQTANKSCKCVVCL